MSLVRPTARADRALDSANQATAVLGRGEAGSVEEALRPLSPTQQDIVQIFEVAVQRLGLSKSVGQIFGVIYSSPRPLAFTDVVASLELSAGSVSQGLHFLRELGAIKVVASAGERRELFVPETELRRLLVGVLQARLREPLEAGRERLKAVRQKIASSAEPDREFLIQRVGSLETWHRKALLILPLIQRFLGPDQG